MRRPALALIVAMSGCNWVFGLESTQLRDGNGDDGPDAPNGTRDRLVWGIAATDSTGAPLPPIFKPIGSEAARDMVPTIMVGGPLGMPLATAAYDVTDGSFEIPFTLREEPHRIVYTLPNETVPHEIQWSIAGALIVVPRTTRYDAPVIPTNSGYSIDPTGLSGTPSLPSLTTTGVFTFDRLGPFGTSSTSTTYDFDANADMLTSPRGAPQGSLGDFIILGDWTGRGGTQESYAGFAITHIDLVADSQEAPQPQPPWMSGTAYDRTLTTIAACPDCIPSVDTGTLTTRLDGLGPLSSSTKTQSLMYGISPTTKLPGFVPGPAPEYVEQPLILPFLTSRGFDSSITLADPTKPTPSLLPFDRVITARMSAKRVVDGATLTTSISAITTTFSDQFAFKAPLATMITLGANNMSAADGLMIDASSQATTLKWNDEAGIGAGDDYIVTLYEITNNRLAPLRIYHVLTPTVTVDGSQLTPAHEYVFAITSRVGLPKAKQGNYDTVTFPFSQTTTFATAFTVKP